MLHKDTKISILGDGGWGTTLALLLSGKGYEVKLWGAFPKYIEEIRKKRENLKFLPGFKIPENVHPVSDIHEACAHAEWIVLAVPSQFMINVRKLPSHSPCQVPTSGCPSCACSEVVRMSSSISSANNLVYIFISCNLCMAQPGNYIFSAQGTTVLMRSSPSIDSGDRLFSWHMYSNSSEPFCHPSVYPLVQGAV